MQLHEPIISFLLFLGFVKMNNMKESYRCCIDFTVQNIVKRLKMNSPFHLIKEYQKIVHEN